MKQTKREWMRGRLNEWEKFPDEFECFLRRIAAGASFEEMCRMHCFYPRVFKDWAAEDPARWAKLNQAMATRTKLRVDKRNAKRQESMTRRQAFKLICHIQRASPKAWQGACRFLNIAPVPERPKW